MTENHEYETPEKGATNWNVPINGNFERLDRDVEIRDSESNLDTYTPKPGAFFLATDTENEYLADGKQWHQLASSGKNPDFESLQTNKINGIPVLTGERNPQAILDAAAAANIGEVWVAKPIELTESLTVPHGLVLRGYGAYNWIDQSRYGAGFYGDIDGELISLSRWSQITGLCIENRADNGVGVRCDGYTVIDRCRIFARGTGLHIRKRNGWDAETKVRNNTFISDTGSGSGSTGVYTDSVPDIECHDNIVVGFETGVHLTKGEQQVTGNHVYTGTVDKIDYGFRFNGRVRFVGNKTGVCSVACVEFSEGFAEQVHNNRLLVDNGAYCIHYNLGSPSKISRSRITNNWLASTTDGFVGDTAIKGTNVTGVYDTIIEQNTIEEFNNPSIRTANSGKATVPAGKKTTGVSHGLVDRPRIQDISLTLGTPLGNASTLYVSNTDTERLELSLDTTPGRSVSVFWRAYVRDN